MVHCLRKAREEQTHGVGFWAVKLSGTTLSIPR